MATTLTSADTALVDHAAALLDRAGRRTSRSAVALHALAAAQLLASERPTPPDPGAPDAGEPAALRDALHLLGQISTDALRGDEIAEALHQTILAYLAGR
jgi:hypothetical protein